ncbi:MAG: histidine phosphatase family protein [Mycobacterium sp.]|uniref:histidine phosphatase family protein n=1 Tax=Mycobacterium sp. TaxID=1785 RepID=UPI003CC6CC15
MRLRHVAVGLLSAGPLFLGSATAWADESITLDFVRHGESGDMAVINTLVPGPSLTELGRGQASDVATALQYSGIDEIYASTMIRSQETAAPLAELLGLPVHDLPGLNEIDAGIFEGAPVDVGNIPLGGALYLLAPVLWTLGLDFVPEPGSSDFDGMEFEDRVNGAVQTIYDTTVTNGDSTDAVFSHEGTIAIWTLMNVNNPDFQVVLEELLQTGDLLPYTGTVEVQGDPADGWTLVDWDGQPVPQDPGLATDLFVDARDLITAPQMAAYHIWEAVTTGDPTTITDAIQNGVSEVSTATAQFPQAVIDDVVDALHSATPELSLSDPASGLPMIAAESTGALSAELSTMVGEILTAF